MEKLFPMKGASTIALFLWAMVALAQADTTKKLSDYLQLRGYIKNMQILSFADLDEVTNDNLVHNRLNLRYFATDEITVAVELRNRIFTGESVNANPNYARLVDVDNGYADLSWTLIDRNSLVFLAQVDRAWVDWYNERWEVRVGRQRINWGTNLFWNANDLFNTYSLVDFDYEERPGADAVRVQHHFANMNTIDVAVRPGENDTTWIGAVRYQFNQWQYDIQLLAGWWNTDYVAGIGWAGNMGNAGLKGEATYFHPQEEGDGVVSASISADYVFSNQLFLTGGFLLNSDGVDHPLPVAQNLFVAPLSAKRLMPARHSVILSVNYPISPILSGGLVTIYSPGVNTALVMPSLGYSIANNWEIALYGQSFWMELEEMENIGNGVFVRLKGSF